MRKLSWNRIADGRVWRLKQGKHFAAEPGAFEGEVEAAAAQMGKAVRLMRDELGKFNYLWVQFADYELPLGSCCPCGSVAQLREHQYFGRCPGCGATFIYQWSKPELRPEQVALAKQDAAAFADGDDHGTSEQAPVHEAPPDRAESDSKPEKRRLDGYSGVELRHYETKGSRDRWYGHGVDAKGRQVLLLVEYSLDEKGERLEDAERPGEFVYRLSSWPVDPFSEIIDVDRLHSDRGSVD